MNGVLGRVAILGLSLTLAGCKGESAPVRPAASSNKATGPAGQPPAAANDAYLVTYDRENPLALWRVHDGKVHRLSLDCRSVSELQLGADKEGRLWVFCEQKLWRFEGSRGAPVSPPERLARKLTIGTDGSVWAHAHTIKALYRRDGDRWHRVEVPEAYRGYTLAVDSRGQPWISTISNALVYRQGEQWKRVDLPKRARVAKIRPLRDGAVLLQTYRGYLRVRDGKVQGKEPLAPGRYSFVAAGSKGYLLLRGTTRLGFVSASGKLEREIDLGEALQREANATGEHLAEVDARGRVWLTLLLAGLAVVGDQGISHWEPGRVPGLGRQLVRRVVVAGRGPKLPSLRPPIRGEVAGRIDGPAGTPVEMCVAGGGFTVDAVGPARFSGATPCASSSARLRARLDDKGRFLFKGVPPLPLTLVYRQGRGRWRKGDKRCCTTLKQGQRLDLGDVR
jgi:hypothetical protein